jgi:threonine synthase
MPSRLVCFNPSCGQQFPIDAVLYECPSCSSLVEVDNDFHAADAEQWKQTWLTRKTSREPLDVSGVWRFRELLPFVEEAHVVTIREGNTPLFDAPPAAPTPASTPCSSSTRATTRPAPSRTTA